MERPDSLPAAPEPAAGAPVPGAPLELPVANELPETEPAPLPLPADNPPQPTSRKPRRPRRYFSPYRLLLVLAVGFVSLFLFIRTFAVEPFGVPTGSMAPALIGNHREGPCPRCGYPVRVGFPTAGGNPADHFARVGCPNCGNRFSLGDAIDLNGDRLLVDKNVFNLRRPRRWEIAVFRCPDPDPKECGKPYVKRVVGLPGETITLVDGDAYANGELLRKGLAEVRETRVIVFDMLYVPSPNGWNARWLVEPPENDPRLPRATNRGPREADEKVLRDGVLTLDALEGSVGVTYRHWNFDERKEEPVRVWSSYDGLPRSFAQLPAAHDFSLQCEVEVVAASGEASFACRLFDGADAVSAEITVGPRPTGRAILTHDGHGPLGSTRGVSLEPKRRYTLEFAFVDRRATVALDGKTILPPADLLPLAKRGEAARPLQFGARGCHLVIRNLRLFRDTHYTHYGEHGTQRPALLGREEYFVLGDNSGNSQDSRKWPRPGVPEADFLGKPFLIHQPLRPARVTVGGRERVFQTVDWSRLRWLH
jgi:signal peptidase I